MRARLVVFPIRGRNWCFSRSIDPAASDSASAQTPSTFKDLWTKISSSSSSKSDAVSSNAEIVTDFISFKMNKAWTALEKAPHGSFKNKLHGIGLKLLSRVKPSEIFLKSITKDVTSVEITYPSSLNPRLVRRRLRHIALRGAAIHRKYFYGSVSMLPLTSAFTVCLCLFWFYLCQTFLSFGFCFARILIGELCREVKSSFSWSRIDLTHVTHPLMIRKPSTKSNNIQVQHWTWSHLRNSTNF
ncbi:uncharacterized protein LOC120084733 isoform X3 [Benincasa hispida]|uniref:uncharacterized protein LOC120084733 isoform X3 n=1 Tax=Benincasa hispida TaxID=102211 RepID=UPI001901BDA3|nr:uncharacterized protein LOC120084733 isoform X3 [Benincasa hispida]